MLKVVATVARMDSQTKQIFPHFKQTGPQCLQEEGKKTKHKNRNYCKKNRAKVALKSRSIRNRVIAEERKKQ